MNHEKYKALLEESALYRFFALLFQSPRPGRIEELAGMAPEVHEKVVQLLDTADGTSQEYHFILGSAGVCSPCESEYVGDKLGGKGSLMADVAGFYKAFAFPYNTEMEERVDHIAVELSFLSYLRFKEAYALFRGDDNEMTTCSDALEKFRSQHFLLWMDMFKEKLEEAAPDSVYAQGAAVMCDCLTV